MANPYDSGPSRNQFPAMKRSPPDMGPPPFPASYPPPNIFYAGNSHPPGPPMPVSHNSSDYFPSADSLLEPNQERNRPNFSLSLPPPGFNPENSGPFTMPINYLGAPHPLQPQPYGVISPYGHHTPGMPSNSDSDGAGMNEYFPPYPGGPTNVSTPDLNNHGFVSPPWQTINLHNSHLIPPTSGPAQQSTSRGGKANSAKTSRQQFTACGACRHRRVKCDLKEKQEMLELESNDNEDGRVGPTRRNNSSTARRKRAICTNCEERGTNCVDEYAPLKAAKQLRRGKRISEIEMLYGRNAANAAVESNAEDTCSNPSPKKKLKEIIPELTKEFFESPFFRRFQVQRPLLDPNDFVPRYLSQPIPTAAGMGPEGAIVVHIIYAWAVSYGVDENGQLDIPEGGSTPMGPLHLTTHGGLESEREYERQRRRDKLIPVLEIILKEIDDYGVMRKPTWDGVRCLMLILPLTEGISTPVERLAMYETALNQVYALCSFDGLGYDGMPSGASGVNGGSDQDGETNQATTRIRIYWYAFVHEGITTGLKGGRLHLDDEDLDTIQETVHKQSLILNSSSFRTIASFATAPVNLALGCRLINKALTGPAARRRKSVDTELVKSAWESLEKSWEEFEALKSSEPTAGAYPTQEDVLRFADGWKIFLFEAQNIIRTTLDERLKKLISEEASAKITDTGLSPASNQEEIIKLQRLLEISKGKCEVQCQQIMNLVKRHAGTRFFEWDAGLVRDGTYYAAIALAKEGGSDEDVSICLQALNELRWAHARAWERSADLRKEWLESRKTVSPDRFLSQSWNNAPNFPPHPITLYPHDSKEQLIPSSNASPFPSPSLISPTYDPSTDASHPRSFSNPEQQNNAAVGFDIKQEWIAPNNLGRMNYDLQPGSVAGSINQFGSQTHGSHQNSMSSNSSSGGNSGYAVYGNMPGPPPLLNDDDAGQYLVQSHEYDYGPPSR